MSRKAALVYRDVLARHSLRADHPLKAVRLGYTYDLLEAYGAFDDEASMIVDPRPATEDEILSIHEAEYVKAVKSFSRGERKYDLARFNFSLQGDNPVYDGMYEVAALSTGASILAAQLVDTGAADVAFNISGGLHHAAAGNASGFCVFNDPAVAINYLLTWGRRVVYVDIDAHHGDGVQSAFYDMDRVLTISIHESGRFLFPGTGSVEEMGEGAGKGFSVNLPLFPFTEDDTYLWAFGEVVPPLVEAFAPDIIVTQLGIDTYHSDPLTHLMLSSRGFSEAVKQFARMGLPWLALGGGGYDLGAVARCWALAYGIMAEKEWPDEIPAQYRERLESTQLRDTEVPVSVPDHMRLEASTFAEESVATVKQLIFPVHKLA